MKVIDVKQTDSGYVCTFGIFRPFREFEPQETITVRTIKEIRAAAKERGVEFGLTAFGWCTIREAIWKARERYSVEQFNKRHAANQIQS
jgi:hypothetical protein